MLRTKYYVWVWVLALCTPQVWGSDQTRGKYHVETVAGSSQNGDGGAATAAQFAIIQGIAVDRQGNLYISDTSNCRVRKVAGGVVTTIAGTGIPGFSGDGGAAVNAQLNFPYGLAVDAAGDVYVADDRNDRVRRIAPDGTITTVAGTGVHSSSPEPPYGPVLGPLDTNLLSPRNVAVDSAGNLYIAEWDGHRVRKLGIDGRIKTVAGTGLAGYSGDGGLATLAQLKSPAGMAFDRTGALYIADSGNNIVRKIFPGGTIGVVLGQPPVTKVGLPVVGVPVVPLPSPNPATLAQPIGLAMDGAGTIYVAEAGASAVGGYTALKWSYYVGGGNQPGCGPGMACWPLKSIQDVAVDSIGSLWIAAGLQVQKVDSTGKIQTVAGDGFLHVLGDKGPAKAANLYQPSALTLDGLGNMFIADTGTNRVRQVAPDGTIATLAGTGVKGSSFPLGGPAVSELLASPSGVVIDGVGAIIIADSNNSRIVAVNTMQKLVAVAGTEPNGEISEGLPPLQATLAGPQAICTDRGGNIYIVDTGNHRVLKLPPNGVLQTVAGNWSIGYAGDGGLAPLAQLNSPEACAVDSAGTLYIADTGNHAIRKVLGGFISTVAGNGASGSDGDEASATGAHLFAPQGVAVDDAGEIFIADTGNNRIRMVTADGLIHGIAGTGTAGFAGDGGPANSAQLNGPKGLFLDGAGDLYFAEWNNNRIRRLLPDPPVPAPVLTPVSLVTVQNALSGQIGAIAPGEIVNIFGTGLGPDAGITGAVDGTTTLGGTLGGVVLQICGTAAPIFYAQSVQITAQVPYEVAGSDTCSVNVQYQGQLVGTVTAAVTASAPALLGLATNQDGTTNGQVAPAARNTWMTFYATGEGMTDSGNADGVPAAAPYSHPLQPISLTIAGVNAEILFAGSAPGLIGMMQINAMVPGGFVAPGEASVVLAVGTVASPAIQIWLQ
jgi:uncharacterized protein (TIGR03437 family)